MSGQATETDMNSKLDPTLLAITYGEWCQDNGYDPVTRTYLREPDEPKVPHQHGPNKGQHNWTNSEKEWA